MRETSITNTGKVLCICGISFNFSYLFFPCNHLLAGTQILRRLGEPIGSDRVELLDYLLT